ncbi:GGDEF domain-containing protein [Comamonas sp. Y33R10-2]|uniref:GGDEF domain-containing protein n=1 Tax=Comamonas sp. Y33R10-2 TaxID=2853257 RepID=UPI001C5C9891|nr:GGDEF domain-containing protein [Comamonas sp. Y33R10-2]QXZ10204.1 GGDEF domain-containing protein [Comamonas sp. Y33R10-2]
MSIADAYHNALAPTWALLFLASILLSCWIFLRKQRFLLWQSCAYTLTACSFAIQSLASTESIKLYAPFTATLYLLGAWFLAKCWNEHWQCRPQPLASCLIGITALVGITYYSHDLWTRVQISSLGTGFIMLLPVVGAFRQLYSKDWLSRILFLFALLYVVLIITRPIFFGILGYSEIQQLVPSVFWFAATLSTLLFSLVFTVLMTAIAIRTTIFQLREERDQDSLTQILNRRAFYEMARCRLSDKRLYPMAIITGDIDHFKHINDTWGHSCGDKALQLISSTLQRNLRSHDLVSRFGGEEFVLLLTHIDLSEAEQVALRIRNDLRSNQSALPINVPLTMSFGIASVNNADGLEAALKEADELMYAAKNAGRDQVHVSGIHYPDIYFEQTRPSLDLSTHHF